MIAQKKSVPSMLYGRYKRRKFKETQAFKQAKKDAKRIRSNHQKQQFADRVENFKLTKAHISNIVAVVVITIISTLVVTMLWVLVDFFITKIWGSL